MLLLYQHTNQEGNLIAPLVLECAVYDKYRDTLKIKPCLVNQ